MLLFFFLLGLALGAASPTADHPVKLQHGGCPPFWYSFNGRCYKYVSTHLTWADAELHCVSQRANLVSIHSREEQNFVKALIKSFDHSEERTWIGLSDIHKEGRWMWSDGSAVDFTFWGAGEPNNNRRNEHCVHTNYKSRNLGWNDVPCPLRYASVCAFHIICP